jgi:hypothetical protein
MSEAQIVRLTSGEELLASVTETFGTTENTYNLTQVTIILPGENGNIGLYPFMPYSDIANTGLTLSRDKVLFVTTPAKDLADYHTSLFEEKSDLYVPPEKKIIV